MSGATVYQVPNWPHVFESAKSKTYKIKSQSYMPNKTGLGYKRILKHKDGPAIYGCWCAMIHALSRQQAPREGYCTDTGRIDGRPWTAEDVGLHTDMPEALCSKMLALCSSQGVGWLAVVNNGNAQGYCTDPAGIPGDPLPLPLPLPLQKPKEACAAVVLAFDSPAFAAAWADWQTHRREIKSPLTPKSVEMQMERLKQWGEGRAIKAIRHTIANGWIGIREEEVKPAAAKPAVQSFRNQEAEPIPAHLQWGAK